MNHDERVTRSRTTTHFDLCDLSLAPPLHYPNASSQKVQGMLVKILGSAADGGFPQLNCACSNCSGIRKGSLRGKRRTQTQIAFSPIEDIWFLVGASPDLRAQLLASPEFGPSPDSGHLPIAGIFLPNAEPQSVIGLLHLRELQNYFVFVTPTVQRILKNENRIFKVLEEGDAPAQWQALAVRRRIGCHLSDNPGDGPTFFYSALPLGGEFPRYAGEEVQRNCPQEDASVALLVEQANKRLFVAPSIRGRSSEWLKTAASADVAVIDSTLPLDGPDGLLAQYPPDARGRKILVNMDHSDPILDEASAAYRAAVEAGFEIAYDGMEIQL
jgi:pyrroloquinoline quinone biosynthesis protein B